jgi:hypothetical protein
VENKQAVSKEAVIVEARLKSHTRELNPTQADPDDFPGKLCCTADSLQLIHRLNYETLISNFPSDHSLDQLLGEVVGQVVFLTEVPILR